MPQCPSCKAAIWVGQRYCSTCNSYLPPPEEAHHFCPRCGIRVAAQQKFCHECKATIPQLAETSATTANFWRRSRRVLIFLSMGLAIVALLWLSLRHQTPEPPRLVTPPSQAGSEQTPAAAPSPKAETAPSAPAAQEPSGPAAPAIPAPPEATTPAPSPPRYSVKVRRLSLRAGPSNSAPRIATLNFQDEVELLDTDGAWGRVRDEERNLVGWAPRRSLQPVAVDDPQADP